MTTRSRRWPTSWSATCSRGTPRPAGVPRSGPAVLLLLVGAVGLVLQHGSDLAAVGALVVAAVLVVGAVALSRVHGETYAAVVIAWTGCAYAAVAGLSFGGGSPFLGTPVAAAGGGALAAGLAAALGLAEGRVLLLPPVVAGTLLLATGLVTQAWSADPAVVLTAGLAVAVVAGSVFPGLALGVTGATVGRHVAVADLMADPDEIDLHRLADDARLGHEILVALSATVGLLLVLATPWAVSLGPAGGLVAVLGCVVVMLRPRQYRSGVEVLVGLASGVLGLTSTALSVLWLHPSWRPCASVVVAVTGAGARGDDPVARDVGVAPSSRRRRRDRRPPRAATGPRRRHGRPRRDRGLTRHAVGTQRDLVEAHSFNRRRLVTAFVSGAPGGREIEPTRPGRTIAAGLVLAVLLVAGAAVSGALQGRTPADGDDPGRSPPATRPTSQSRADPAHGGGRAPPSPWSKVWLGSPNSRSKGHDEAHAGPPCPRSRRHPGHGRLRQRRAHARHLQRPARAAPRRPGAGVHRGDRHRGRAPQRLRPRDGQPAGAGGQQVTGRRVPHRELPGDVAGRAAGLFEKLPASVVAPIPAQYRPTSEDWTGFVARSTVLVYNKDRSRPRSSRRR